MDRLALFVPGVAAGSSAADKSSGVVVDPQGAVISGAQVIVTLDNRGTMTTTYRCFRPLGRFRLAFGQVKIQVTSQCFQSANLHTPYDAGQPSRHDLRLSVGRFQQHS